MPGLPGVTTTSWWRPRTATRACSRPPEPTTQTFIRPPGDPSASRGSRVEVQELVPAGTHADERDRHADLGGEEVDVVERLLRQLVAPGERRQVGLPTGELGVDRLRLVQHRLVVREVVDPLAVDLVGDAHLERVQGVEDVELGEGELREGVQAYGVAQHHRV